MIADHKPYPSYKSSGVEWLGNMPVHWKVRRLKYLATLIMGQSPSSEDCSDIPIGPPFLQGCAEFGIHHPTPAQYCRAPSKISPPGAILMSVRAPVGRLNISNQEYGIGRGLCAIVPNNEDLHTGLAQYQLEVLGHGLNRVATGSTYEAVSVGDVGNHLSILPPLPEQTAIVRYLDHTDRRIRRYVSSRERLIELLEEYRQVVIHHAVTRGLDPDVRLKPSGVEWLGDVPAHWEVRRLRNVGEAIIGLTYAPQDVVGEEDGILVLRASNISQGRIVYGDNVFVRCSVPDRLITQEGDILICSRSGSRALIGKNARIDSSSSGATFGAFMTIFRCANNEYLHYVFNSKLFEYQSGAFLTSTINQLTLGMLYSIKIPLPPLPEQKRIIHYLDKATAAIDVAIDRARREIELLGEYRTRLIADVVTGKVDVREAAAELSAV